MYSHFQGIEDRSFCKAVRCTVYLDSMGVILFFEGMQDFEEGCENKPPMSVQDVKRIFSPEIFKIA